MLEALAVRVRRSCDRCCCGYALCGYDLIASECKRFKCTQADWTRDEMVYFVHQKVFNSIPQEGLENHLTRTMTFAKREERAALFQDFVGGVIYKYLATVNAGRDPDAAMDLAVECKLLKVLRNEVFDGCDDWTLEDFIDPVVWKKCGGQAGMRDVARKFMTIIAAGGQKTKPLNPFCGECGELKVMHKGDRLNLTVFPCKCDGNEVKDVAEKLGRRPAATEPVSKRQQRGFSAELDPTCQGMFDTYERKCKQIDQRYPEMSEKDIVKKLLGRTGKEMATDSDDESVSVKSVGVTGEQGGRLLVCFLVRAERQGGVSFLDQGVANFLEKQVPKVALYPSAKLCVEKAIKFLPKLEAGLAKHAADAATVAPTLDFGSDDDE